MAAQAGLCLAWSETPKDTFCHVVVHMFFFFFFKFHEDITKFVSVMVSVIFLLGANNYSQKNMELSFFLCSILP